MSWMIWGGAALSILGLTGILWSIVTVWKAKRADLTDDELRERIKKAMPINMGALFVSVIGLMSVIMGISLG